MFLSLDHHQGVFISFAKITLIKNTFHIPILKLAMWQHVCNTKYIIICLVKFILVLI